MLIQNALPAHEVVGIEVTMIEHFLSQIHGQVLCEKAAYLVAEREIRA